MDANEADLTKIRQSMVHQNSKFSKAIFFRESNDGDRSQGIPSPTKGLVGFNSSSSSSSFNPTNKGSKKFVKTTSFVTNQPLQKIKTGELEDDPIEDDDNEKETKGFENSNWQKQENVSLETQKGKPPSTEILVDFKIYEIVEVPRDGNCFFHSMYHVLRRMPCGKIFDSICDKYWPHEERHHILRRICCYMIFAILFDEKFNSMKENKYHNLFCESKSDSSNSSKSSPVKSTTDNDDRESESEPDNPQLEVLVKAMAKSFYVKKINDRYNENNVLANQVFGAFRQCYKMSIPGEKNVFFSNEIQGAFSVYFKKMLSRGQHVHLPIMGIVISYLFGVQIQCAVIEGRRMNWINGCCYYDEYYDKKNDEEKILPFKILPHVPIIRIVHYSPICDHFDVIEKKIDLDESRKKFEEMDDVEIYNTKMNSKELLDQESKTKNGGRISFLNSHILPTMTPLKNVRFVPSEPSGGKKNGMTVDDLYETSTTNRMDAVDIENVLPDVIDLYCSRLTIPNSINVGCVGKFLKVDSTFKEHVGSIFYITDTGNFDVDIFTRNSNSIASKQFNLFHLGDNAEKTDWYYQSFLKIYSYKKKPKDDSIMNVLSFKDPKNLNRLYFSCEVSQKPDLFILEIGNENGMDFGESSLKSKGKLFDVIVKKLF